MSNFKKLYGIANDIIDIYDQIYILTNKDVVEVDSNEYNNLIEQAKILVLKESNLLSSLEIEELDVILNELRAFIKDNFDLCEDDELDTVEGVEVFLKSLNNKYDCSQLEVDIDALLRIFDRLKNQTFILSGDAIKLKLRRNDEKLISYEVSIWDTIMSVLNIQTLKNTKKKIDSLIPESDNDIKFIDALKYELDCFKFTYLYATFASEIFALYTLNEVDNIVMPSIDKLRELNVLEEDLFSEFILNEAKIIVDDLASINFLERTPECIAYFLRLVTSFEVLILNMDKVTLMKIGDYCNRLTNDNNFPCMDGINNFVKKRIKRNK